MVLYMDSNKCVSCGCDIPEGSQVCNECLKEAGVIDKESEKELNKKLFESLDVKK